MHSAGGLDLQVVADVLGMVLFAVLGFVSSTMYSDVKRLRETYVSRSELAEHIEKLEAENRRQHEANRQDRRDMHNENKALLEGIRDGLGGLKEEIRGDIGELHEKINGTNIAVAKLQQKNGG